LTGCADAQLRRIKTEYVFWAFKLGAIYSSAEATYVSVDVGSIVMSRDGLIAIDDTATRRIAGSAWGVTIGLGIGERHKETVEE
jgi:hypothetical protein